MMYAGYLAATVTPFVDGTLDIAAFKMYTQWLVTHGIRGLVVCGSTGEATALDIEERRQLVNTALDVAQRRVPVIVGVAAPTTHDVISQAKMAEEQGADALMAVCPYYVKPTQEGLYQHFTNLHNNTNLPIIVYNNPARTGVDIKINTLARLAQHPRIVGIKDATGDPRRFLAMRQTISRKFALLSGDDDLTPSTFAMGADGVISVAANIAPAAHTALFNAWTQGDTARVVALGLDLAQLTQALFHETSPGPLKYGLSKLGFMRAEMRGPLCEITDESKAMMDKVIKDLNLLSSIPAMVAA